MQIQSVVLYSNDGRVHEIPFDLGRVNILTGPSGRGKSALLSVIDYCLGSSRFEIPAGVISNYVSWFALKLSFGDEKIFVARRGVPQGRNASSEFFIRPIPDGETPQFEEIKPNARRDDLLDKIDALLGVGVTFLPRADGSAERKKLTFRSGLIYCFQKQNEIANPDLYFHRQSELAQTIRETLPYYLGAISPSIIEKQAALRAARKRLREVERLLARDQSVAGRRDIEATAIVNEGTRLGLVAIETINAVSPEASLDIVRKALNVELFLDEPSSDKADLLKSLNNDLLELTRLRSNINNEIEALERFDADQQAVDLSLNEQRRRMTALNLVADNHDAQSCPLCESALETVTPSVKIMKTSLEKLHSELALVTVDRRDLREELSKRRGTVISLSADIRRIRTEVIKLKEEQDGTRLVLEHRNELARLSGMVEMFQRLISTVGDDTRSALELEKDALISEIDDLEAETNIADLRSKTATFLGAVGQQITKWARQQQLEYANGLLTFDLRGPRLISEGPNETIPFSRFGSGRNWVWYHLLGHLALHDWFTANNRPVPGFLILDQPSQVYFPSSDGSKGEQDLQEVERIYQWLFETVGNLKGRLQIIVTDHAKFDDEQFQNHLTHDWWQGGSLVPTEWIVGGEL